LLCLVKDEKERTYLEHLISKDGKDEMRGLVKETTNYADLLKLFPSAKVPVEYLIDFIPNIKPRLYSIASAPEMFPDVIQLCVVQEDWTLKSGEERHGQSTWFVRNQAPNLQWGTYKGKRTEPESPYGTITPALAPKIPVRVNPAVVHIPDDPMTPLIMVGLGTGMAPFRAFIQQRKVWKDQGTPVGPMLLYFGARFEKTEYLYGAEIEQYHKDGYLTYLKKAFSRDQKEKIYAQHRIDEDPELLYDMLITKKGSFYLCGPAGGMPVQMKEAVIRAVAKVGRVSTEEATKIVTDLQIGGRYNVEVW